MKDIPYIRIDPYVGGLGDTNPHEWGTIEWQNYIVRNDLRPMMEQIVRHVDGFSGMFKAIITIVTPEEGEES